MDERRKRICFRAWRRGFREIDLILGPFADARVAALTDEELEAFERLLELPDQDVYGWIIGQIPTPAEHDTMFLASIKAFAQSQAAP